MNRSVKALKGISVGVVTLLCVVLIASLQSAEPWKPLFNGKDLSGWTAARGGKCRTGAVSQKGEGPIATSASSTFTTLPLHRHNVITALLTFRCSKSELFNSPNSILPQFDCRADGY